MTGLFYWIVHLWDRHRDTLSCLALSIVMVAIIVVPLALIQPDDFRTK